jgi:hypothetical protein
MTGFRVICGLVWAVLAIAVPAGSAARGESG